MTENKELKPQARLSPTSINTYINCPRCYYMQYIYGVQTPPSIHLVKGRIVHSVLEDFFKTYRKDLDAQLLSLFNKLWDKNKKDLDRLELEPEEISKHRTDCINMIMEYYHMFRRQMNMLLDLGKAENDSHAYYLLKPKFRELWVEDKDIHCCGYIDRVNEDYDSNITLGDYKTSSKYGLNFPEDYKRQLSIYALLYRNQEGIVADEVAVDFLRYGEVYRYEVTDDMLTKAEALIKATWENTRSVDIDDYAPNPYCHYKELCKDDSESNARIQKIKELIGDKNGKDDSAV